MSYGGDQLYRQDANLKYLPAETRTLWEQLGAQFEASISQEARAVLEANYGVLLNITAQMKGKGVKMLAGSDLGGIWVLPGFSLHQEFAELEKAGFTPLEVLQSTTLNAGEFLGRQDELGNVAPGYLADLVLLDANPLEAVANLGSISGVVIRKTGERTCRDCLEEPSS